VIHFINGNLGDNSFFDSAASGLDRAEKDLGASVETIQANYNKTNWQPAIDAAASRDDYDILIAGTSDMSDLLQAVAKEHPDKKFILYDALANNSCGDGAGNGSNIYSPLFRQNEGSYLAGVYAASMIKSGVIGVVGGQNKPIINDFIAGYEQGAKSVKSDVIIIEWYAVSWNDSLRGEEIAESHVRPQCRYRFSGCRGHGHGRV
jgi:basic membrane protein A